ncbi:MAG: DUF368 domain-containing protein [Spongiibacter marinus]|uniref:DUF368 domain-containing protein n=1 Tax=Spongiibacter marinus TaxID=354246 RepID=UPI003C596D21
MKGFSAGVMLRGAAMGAADIVPGVSGGTVAFITGIYDQLIESLKACNLQALKLLFTRGPSAAWQYVNGGFLLSLLLGIAISVLSLARAISWALATHPLLLAAFFFGLILASALFVYQQIPGRGQPVGFVVLGLVFALVISALRPAEVPVNMLTVYGAGAVAICAMILPGISGSFILLLLGMYEPIINAIKSMDLGMIAVFMLGCATGLMLFVRLLSYLMHSHRRSLLATLTGILLGSLAVIWPWKLSSAGRLLTDEHSVDWHNVLPMQYAEQADPQWLMCALLMAVGFATVLLLERVASRN